MPNLSCDATNCRNNSGHQCCMNSIDVSGAMAAVGSDTCCRDFVHGAGFMNYAASPKATLSISCAANNCSFNSNGECGADSISISGSGAMNPGATKCASFTTG